MFNLKSESDSAIAYLTPSIAHLDPIITFYLTQSFVSGVDTFQIRSVSETRLIRKLGQISESQMQLISQALAVVLSLSLST